MIKSLNIKFDNKPCYDIHFCQCFQGFEAILDALYHDLTKPSRICIVTDDKVAELYLNELEITLKNSDFEIFSYIFPNGEQSKTLDTVEKLYVELIKWQFTRRDLLIALGGGVVGDITGFVAATFLRGIDFIQIPTSLLAQVDSSIGGKTGVDLRFYKNMVGAFKMPRLVYLNFNVLNTLDETQYSCGMAEVIKYGYIKDASFLTWLYDNKEAILAKNSTIVTEMVYRSCSWKKQVVENDPLEKGERALLNFGHTIGHSIEKNSNFTLSHGQCVALGMIAAGEICLQRNIISDRNLDFMREIISAFNLPTFVDKLNPDDIFSATKSDKKMVGNQIKFVLLDGVGNGFVADDVSDEEIKYAISKVVFK